MKSEEVLQSEIDRIKVKIFDCDQFLEKATGDQKKMLETKRVELEALRDRREVALDLVAGRAFNLHTVDGSIVVVQPSEWTSKMLKKTEEMGAKVESHGKLEVQ